MRSLVNARIAAIEGWLSENAPYCSAEQAHLNENTLERAYWHYGYLIALRDILAAVGKGEFDV